MLRLLPWLLLTLALALAGEGDRDARGWHQGVAAARTAEVLSPPAPVAIDVPKAIAKRLERVTFVYYFSPTCGHCQATIPEVVGLHAELGEALDFLGVAHAHASLAEINAFREQFGVTFPIVRDDDRGFAEAIGARSTPTVVVLEPKDGEVVARDAYFPWRRGLGPLVKLRLWPEQGFEHFKPGVYQGAQTCGACHSSELMSWALSHHAVAYNTLYTRDRAEDTACVGCHVTGMDQPGGFTLGDHGSALTDVGCEACHSAGGPHDGERVDARTSCVGCHDAEHSINFSVDKGLPHIDHFLADHLSQEEQDARWRALASGEAERPLLAFPEGDNLGAEACVSCHGEVVEAWRGSPHAQAMGTLNDKQGEDLDCVRCHATPTRQAGMGEPLTLAEHRVSEGVGCESCHGPGERHVAAPSADNILGLGASCPECVIEEVCTSCHTPKWDKGWALHPRLDAIRGHGAPASEVTP